MVAAFHRFFLRVPLILIPMFVVIGGPAMLTGCATDSLARDETLGWSADKLYAEAKDEMGSGNWTAAIKMLEKLESRYPFGRYAQQAQIDTAYAHWKQNENVLALAAVDRFMKLYPNHENVDYVLYLKGLINFNDRSTLFSNITGEDLSERDPKAAREAFDSFKELVTRFPKSKYAEDAEDRMSYLVNMLASNEVHVARFYMRRGATLAAVNRAQSVVKQYQEAPAIEEALSIMMEGYARLGLNTLSSDARRVLETNFPASRYLASSAGTDDRDDYPLKGSVIATPPAPAALAKVAGQPSSEPRSGPAATADIITPIPNSQPINVSQIPANSGAASSNVTGQSASTASAQDIESQTIALTKSWARAWSAKDFGGYVGFYSERFRPQTYPSVQAWRNTRQLRLSKPGPINVVVSGLKASRLASGDVRVSFQQDYSSKGFVDTTEKNLVWTAESGTWKILSESDR